MQIATHNWMRPESIRRTIERMKQTGVDALELSGEPDQFDAKEVRALLKEHGRKAWGSVTLTLGDRNLAAKDPVQRAKTVDYMKRVVTLAKEIEGQIVSVVPVTVGKVVPDSTIEEEWKWLVDGLREVYAHSEKAGIRLAIEPLNRFETNPVDVTPEQMKFIIDHGSNLLADTFYTSLFQKSTQVLRPLI